MKTKAIVEETRIIRQANEELPPKERSETRLRTLYRTAAQEVDHERTFDQEKFMYMSDDDMSELVKQKFDEKLEQLPGMEPAETEKEPDTEIAEDAFAEEMNEMPAEDDEFNFDDIMGDDGDGVESEGSVDDVSNDELEAFLGPLDDESSSDDDEVLDDEESSSEAPEGESDEESEEEETSPAEEVNKE